MVIRRPMYLQTGDVLLWGAARLNPKAMLIRSVTAKRPFDTTVATHADIICEVHGQRLIVAMDKRGIEVRSPMHPPRTLRLLGVRRHTVYSQPEAREALARRLALDLRHSIEYDYKGILGFVFHRVRHCARRYYCSEHVVAQTQQDGVTYPASFETRVSPYALQVCGCGWWEVNQC